MLFLAPGERDVEGLRATARSYLAWRTLQNDADRLELTRQQRDTVATRLRQESDALSIRLREAYKHLLAPRQTNPQDLNAIDFDLHSLSGAGSVLERAVRKIEDAHVVLRKVGGTVLALALKQRSPRWGEPHMRVSDLLEDLAQYPYLDLRASTVQVVLEAIADGAASTAWAQETFAYADGYDESRGRYLGLVRGALPRVVSPTGLIVKPEVALAQEDVETPAAGGVPSDTATVPTGAGVGAGDALAAPKRFHGSVGLDPDRPVDAVARLAREILAHAPTDAEVDLILDVEIRTKGGFEPTQAGCQGVLSRPWSRSSHGDPVRTSWPRHADGHRSAGDALRGVPPSRDVTANRKGCRSPDTLLTCVFRLVAGTGFEPVTSGL